MLAARAATWAARPVPLRILSVKGFGAARGAGVRCASHWGGVAAGRCGVPLAPLPAALRRRAPGAWLRGAPPRRSYQHQRTTPQGRASEATTRERNTTLALYAASVVVAAVGASYAAVPLYKLFCQATGYGGTTQQATEEKFKAMRPVEGARPITVQFNADTGDTMEWSFTPAQRVIRVVPGETALAFYTARNPTNKPITGVSTYNVTPMRAGVHFNKIQCFCFEEQRLRANEEVDMPVLFYIDPEFLDDPSMANINTITLSYTFFKTGEEAEAGAGAGAAQAGGAQDDATERSAEDVRAWTQQMVDKLGVQQVPEQMREQGVVGVTKRGVARTHTKLPRAKRGAQAEDNAS